MNNTKMMMTMAALAALACFIPAVGRADGVLVTGAGATFPYPLYSKWFGDYNKLQPNARFNYQSIGSGGGVKQITERTVDFGASDAPMSDEELTKAKGLLHIPTVLGAIAIVYQGAPDGLKLDGATIANIFLGKVTKWNDAAISASNPGVKLPDTAIVVVHRSDGSGTSAVFTDYLAKISPAWKSQVGAAKSVKWPVGLGGKGNEGVTATVKSMPGAIGYVELAYARQNKLAIAAIKNADGQFVLPSTDSASEAAAGQVIPDDMRVSVTNARGAKAYPIASFTYLLVYREQTDAVKGRALAQFLWWAIHDGQSRATPLDYAPLPRALLPRIEALVKTITVEGRSVIATK